MRFRLTHAMTILLLVAAMSPPKISAILLDLGHRVPTEQSSRKMPQVRGRNRVPSAPRANLTRVEGRLGSGNKDRRSRARLSSERYRYCGGVVLTTGIHPPPSVISMGNRLRC